MVSSQEKILDYCLKNCVFDGWTHKLLENACIANNLEPLHWKIYFPNGAIDLVDCFIEHTNKEMATNVNLEGLRTHEKVRECVKWRLQYNENRKAAINSMLKLCAQNPIRATKANFKAVDAIWRLCGDKSTDWNYYSKRMLLAGVYNSTILFWLNDNSPNHEKTWEFLDKRLVDVAKFGKGINELRQKISGLSPSF